MKEATSSHLEPIDTPSFINKLKKDYKVATKIANNKNLKFDSPLLAVYHFRKHGEEFASFIASEQINVKVYLTIVPRKIVQDGNLTNIETVTNADGSSFIRKTYLTPQDHFAVTIEGLDRTKISTMFTNSGKYATLYPEPNQLPQTASQTPTWSFLLGGLPEQLSQSMGFPGTFTFLINFDKPEDEFELKHGVEKVGYKNLYPNLSEMAN